MQGIDTNNEPGAPRRTVESQSATPVPSDRSAQRAAEHASQMARALSGAGYEPRHLSVTYSETGDLVLVARLDRRAPVSRSSGGIARVAIGVTLGLVLGFFGLPRLELSGPGAPQEVAAPTPDAVSELAPREVAEVMLLPTVVRPPATPTAVPAPGALLRVGPFASALQGWIDDPRGTAWFGDGMYHLNARDQGRFVATKVPLTQPLHDAEVSARFHKLDGPSGGGYGLIVRDQGRPAERDGRNQSGEFIVVEIGDRGDIGVWQRDQMQWIDIAPWTHSDAVHADRQPNELTVITRGNALEVRVNGQIVANLDYDRLPPSGGVGIFTGGDLNEVALDWIRIENSH